MTRVDFYLLDQHFQAGPELYACRLAEKAYQAGHRIHIQTASAEDGKRLDDLLWTFRQGSFVPHRLANSTEASVAIATPITIGAQEDPAHPSDVLINLSGQIPREPTRYARIAEVVGTDSDSKSAARERYRQYREQRLELHHHDITA